MELDAGYSESQMYPQRMYPQRSLRVQGTFPNPRWSVSYTLTWNWSSIFDDARFCNVQGEGHQQYNVCVNNLTYERAVTVSFDLYCRKVDSDSGVIIFLHIFSHTILTH